MVLEREGGPLRGNPMTSHLQLPWAATQAQGGREPTPPRGVVPSSARRGLARYFSYLDTVWSAKWATSWGSSAGEYLDLLTQ